MWSASACGKPQKRLESPYDAQPISRTHLAHRTYDRLGPPWAPECCARRCTSRDTRTNKRRVVGRPPNVELAGGVRLSGTALSGTALSGTALSGTMRAEERRAGGWGAGAHRDASRSSSIWLSCARRASVDGCAAESPSCDASDTADSASCHDAERRRENTPKRAAVHTFDGSATATALPRACGRKDCVSRRSSAFACCVRFACCCLLLPVACALRRRPCLQRVLECSDLSFDLRVGVRVPTGRRALVRRTGERYSRQRTGYGRARRPGETTMSDVRW